MKNRNFSININSPCRAHSIFVAAIAALFAGQSAQAAASYWDTNSTTAGAGATPTNTWNTTNTFFNSNAAGTSATTLRANSTTSGDTVTFSAGTDAINSYAVTASGTVAASGLVFEDGTVSLAGTATPVLQLGTNGIVVNTTVAGGVTLNSTLASIQLVGNQSWTNNSLTNALTIQGNVDNTVASTLTITGAGSTAISGNILNGTGTTILTKTGLGTLTLSGASAYTGATTINSGLFTLAFGAVSTNILPSGSALTLGGGRLNLTGTGTQTLNGLTTSASTGSQILTGANQTLTLGALTAAGTTSTLLVNTVAGGANGAAVGTGIVNLSGPTAGSAINSGFTVLDAGGFGLATVDGSNNVIRLAATALLPASGATSATDYQIDNNAGGVAADGSSSLTVSAAESAKSITVDTTAASGVLTLDSGIVLSSNIWNFGGGSNTYQVTGSTSGAGLSSVASGDAININNFNTGVVTIASPILANGTNNVNLLGSGTSVFAGTNTYTGATVLAGGTLKLSGTGTLGATTSTLGAITNGGVLDLNGTSQTIGGFSGTSNGQIQNNSGVVGTSLLTISGSVTGTFAGVIADNNGISTGGTVAIERSGSGITTLSGASTFSGGTTLTTGTLLSGTTGAYAGGALVSGGLGKGPLTLNGGTFGGNNVNVGNATTVNANILINSASRLELSGPWNMGGGTRTLTLGRATLFSATSAANTTALQLNTQTNGPQVSVTNGTMHLLTDPAVAATSYTAVHFFGNTNFTGNAGLTIGNRVVVFINNNDLLGGTTASNLAALTVESGGYLNITGQGFTAPRNLTVSSLSGSGTVTNLSTAAGTSVLTVNGTTSTAFSGSIVNGTTLGSAGSPVVFSGIAPVGVVGLTKSGNSTLTLSGTNTYTGITTISSSGVISTASLTSGGIASPIGAATSAATNLVLNNGTLQYTGATVTIDRNLTVNNTNGGTIEVTSAGTNLTTGTVTSSSGTNPTLTKTGDGTLTLVGTADNAFLRATVNAGTLILGKNPSTSAIHAIGGTLTIGSSGIVQIGGSGGDQIHSGVAVTINGGTFDINSLSEGVAAVTLNGGSITGTTGILTGSSYAVMSGSASAILGGSGALTKSTAGTVTLSGVNTYTGNTTVSAGTLSLGNAFLSNTSTLAITTATGVLDLTHSDTDVVVAMVVDGVPVANGVYGGSGAVGIVDFTVPYITGTGKIQVVTNYATWAAINAGGQTANLDFDNDGTSNGIEYFMGAPAGFTANPSPVGGTVTWTNGGNIPSGDYGTQFVVQSSTDLVIWTDVPVGTGPLGTVTNTSGSVSYTLPTGADKTFGRLVLRPN